MQNTFPAKSKVIGVNEEFKHSIIFLLGVEYICDGLPILADTLRNLLTSSFTGSSIYVVTTALDECQLEYFDISDKTWKICDIDDKKSKDKYIYSSDLAQLLFNEISDQPSPTVCFFCMNEMFLKGSEKFAVHPGFSPWLAQFGFKQYTPCAVLDLDQIFTSDNNEDKVFLVDCWQNPEEAKELSAPIENVIKQYWDVYCKKLAHPIRLK